MVSPTILKAFQPIRAALKIETNGSTKSQLVKMMHGAHLIPDRNSALTPTYERQTSV